METNVFEKMFECQKAFAKSIAFKEAHPAIDQYFDCLKNTAQQTAENAKKVNPLGFAVDFATFQPVKTDAIRNYHAKQAEVVMSIMEATNTLFAEMTKIPASFYESVKRQRS